LHCQKKKQKMLVKINSQPIPSGSELHSSCSNSILTAQPAS